MHVLVAAILGAVSRVMILLQLTNSNLTASIGIHTKSGFRVSRSGSIRSLKDPAGDGALESGTDGVNSNNEWVRIGRSSTVGDDFEVKLDLVSGTTPATGPALATWHTINTDRDWITDLGEDFSGTLSIRDIATSGTSHSVSATFTVTWS